MADPTPYTVSYSFSGFQANSPTTPLPAPRLDDELANAATAIASLVAAVKDIRREDGALNNGIVTFDSFELGLQLTIDPTNGALVAAAVAGAQASAATATTQAGIATTQAGIAATQAAAAAASAAGVDLTLYLPKAGNLGGLGSVPTARANLQVPNIDGSDITGRLAVAAFAIADWNSALTSGWYSSSGGANEPFAGNWFGQVIGAGLYVSQTAYNFTAAATSVSAVIPYRRFSYDSGGGVRAWQPWESIGIVPTGTTIWCNGNAAPPGYLKENGALLSRASFPALYAFAAASGNMTTEAGWTASQSGSFSSGDLSTTFRIPDSRGEFIRGYDDGRGIDAGRVIGSRQADTFKDHTHQYSQGQLSSSFAGGGGPAMNFATVVATAGASTGSGTETRGRNIPKLACIKY